MYKYILLFLWLAGVIYSEEINHNKKCVGNQPMNNIIECVLDHSPEYRIAKADLEASLGRRKIASYTFPSNPTISASTGTRSASSSSLFSSSPSNATNGEILLSQEVYIGGQREVKIEVAQSDIKTKIKRIQAIERNTISQTVNAILVFQAAWEEYKLTKELNSLSKEIAKIASLRFKNGIGAEMDSEIAVSESIKMNSLEELTRRKWQDAKTDIVVMMGVSFAVDLEVKEEPSIFNVPLDDMEPFVQMAEIRRPDLEVLELEIQLSKNRIRLLQREKIPNLTFSGYAQNDGFNEKVIGARISIPLQIWRDNSGEIKEAQALSKISEEQMEVGSHTVRFEAIKAWNSKDSWKRAWINFPPNIMERTNENLNILKEAISTGKISVKDALVTQRSLIELKANYFQTKAGYAISCNEYLRAGGIDLNEFFLMDKKHENKN